ncbi:MAG: hypothetical protein H6667_10905 [Ardenticatenaceae bacterium]|nr:hypothetical protein [Ardenticatenaceae bacterium]MCB9444388.1 hypothetical protein [Ardenticatenaceae bacterium]
MAGLIQLHKPRVWLLVAGVIVLLLEVKVGRPFLLPASPPDFGNQPALLFFNNKEGCECVLPLYTKADEVIAVWTSNKSARISVHRFILDERPDLQRRYKIERAPMLLLLDADEQVVWREWGVASDPNVFDLARVETKISLLLAAASSD